MTDSGRDTTVLLSPINDSFSTKDFRMTWTTNEYFEKLK